MATTIGVALPPKDFRILAFPLGIVITLLVLLGLPPGHSAPFNYGWSAQYTEALSWTNPLPRYLPGLWAGFGGYDFFFYAPLPFWFVGAFVGPLCQGCAVSTELVLGASLMLAASSFTMLQFLRLFFSASPAAFGAAIYILLPYHLLIDWFERQAVGEFTAYVFIPLIARGVEAVRRNEGGGCILSLGIAGAALSHLPTTLLALHVFVASFLFIALLGPGGFVSRIHLIARLSWFGGLGLALASFYWFPAIVLLDSVSPGVLFDEYFQAWRWLYGQAAEKPNSVFAFRVLASFLVCFPLLLASLYYARGPLLLWILVPVIFAVFMNTSLSETIWREGIIYLVQFPWRLMTLVDFSTGIAAAVLANYAFYRIGRLLFAIALTAALIPATFLVTTVKYSQPDVSADQRYLDWFAAVEYLSPEMTETLQSRLGQSRVGHSDQRAIASAIMEMEADFRAIQEFSELLDRGPRSFTIAAEPGASSVSILVQYWFLWKAETISGSNVEIRANPNFGTLDIIAPEGGFQREPIIVWLPLHPSEIMGGAASLVALLIMIALLFKRRRRRSSRGEALHVNRAP